MAHTQELYIDHKLGLTRMAYFRDGVISDLWYEFDDDEAKVGDIYYAKVTRIVPSMQATFLDIGSDNAGFLPKKNLQLSSSLPIEKQLHEGQHLILQVVQPARGQGRHRKGATLSCDVSLSSGSIVYLPQAGENSVVLSKHLKISPEIEDKRDEIKAQLIAEKISGQVIFRSRALELISNVNDDLSLLLNRWKKVQDSIKRSRAVRKLSSEGSIIKRQLNLSLKEVDTIISSNARSMSECKDLLGGQSGYELTEFKVVDADTDFYSRALKQAEEQALCQTVDLPSGGSMVFDETEALTVVDVNTASASGDKRAQETTNLEAATELARQLRLRQISGIIVIDFINTQSEQHDSELLAKLRGQLAMDWNKTTCEAASKLGLVEVTRFCSGLSLSEIMSKQCSCCLGTGVLRNERAVVLQLLEELEQIKQDELGVEVLATPEVLELLKRELVEHYSADVYQHWELCEQASFSHGDYEIRLGRGA